jgi:uncharacterized membrane protein YphA (DoxX/SURF4 family)
MDDLWQKTQDPGIHQRWDLRFSQIEYLPRVPGEPQKFRYVTRIGAGLRIEGAGESSGEQDDELGRRTSALKFWSADRKSLIETGSGYWKYIPKDNGILFLTWYDYRTRFGLVGRIVDRVCFRPLLGWATAWSFDRLRVWTECGVAPEISRICAFAYTLSRLTLAFAWIYQGLVPKLIFRSVDELRMLRDAGIPESRLAATLSAIGVAEVVFGVLLLVLWRRRWPLWLTIMMMVVALIVVALCSSSFLPRAFNPVTLNLAIAALAAVGLLLEQHVPTATRCRRQPRGDSR